MPRLPNVDVVELAHELRTGLGAERLNCVYTDIVVHTCVCVYIYVIYIYREREMYRERDVDIDIDMYIYMYIHI